MHVGLTVGNKDHLAKKLHLLEYYHY